ncbi:aspartate aminotransferase family protein [Aquirhabdus parva]|uniref:Acetylornithine aminotransferase n=1 Tax=Aquirhabdus parva TaxID=2283318 RepID=A0A345P4J5_9GAMM|nr:aspartate aminotransferase family protein [Aquirhabdus parva]AXI02204.1 aspartate aminotransferase family protein [Aquirhabdus parva]
MNSPLNPHAFIETSAQTSHLMPTYARQPIAFVRGRGSYLYTADGTEYLDALTGIAVCGLGHVHPAVTAALVEQAETLVHTSNLFEIPWQEDAGRLLCQVGGMERCFFSNSGAEANEAAIKLARMNAYKKGITTPKIIVMEKSFHGRTLATLSATGNEKVQKGFYPLVEGFLRVPFGDVAAIETLAKDHDDIVAILVEPIQGEGGVNTAPQGFVYLEELRAICDQHDWLLMLDEIQTGNGRTGQYFAYQHTAIKPDVLTTAKGLGNGFPVGACLVRDKAADLFSAGNHGSTFGGTPLACRTVYAVIESIQKEKATENAAKVGQYLKDRFTEELSGLGVIVRGFGMMLGIELPRPCGELVAKARDEQHLILNVTADNVIRLLPALNLSQADADKIITRVVTLVKDFLAA